MHEFGPWMLVKIPIYKKIPKPNNTGSKEKDTPNKNPPSVGASGIWLELQGNGEQGMMAKQGEIPNQDHGPNIAGPHYAILGDSVESDPLEESEDTPNTKSVMIIEEIRVDI